MPTPAQLAKARLGDAAKAREMARARMRDEAKGPTQPVRQLVPQKPRLVVQNLAQRSSGSVGSTPRSAAGSARAGGRAAPLPPGSPPASPEPEDAGPPKLRVRSANELRAWQCKLTLQADHALEGSMATRALLRECEQLIYEDDQETRRAERTAHDSALASSSDDPVRRRRLERCDELQQVLADGRDGLAEHSARLDLAAQESKRMQRALGAMAFSDAEIAAELVAQQEEEGAGGATFSTASLLHGDADEAMRGRAARRAARHDKAEQFLAGVDWSRLDR